MTNDLLDEAFTNLILQDGLVLLDYEFEKRTDNSAIDVKPDDERVSKYVLR